MAAYAFETLRSEYSRYWRAMKIRPQDEKRTENEAKRIISRKSRYLQVELSTGVPWFVVGCLHSRESDLDFCGWLHNGDWMRSGHCTGEAIRTRHVPAGRPPNPNVTWEAGAKDALRIEQLTGIRDWSPEHVAYAAEKFNGFGYRRPDIRIPSPYLWGGTNIQRYGKFVADRQYSPSAWDSQLGTMPILQKVMELDDSARFIVQKPLEPVEPVPPLVETTPPPSPRAITTESNIPPLTESKTIWGGVLAGVSGMVGGVSGFVSALNNPYALTGFIVIVVCIGVGVYLVMKGRIDAQALIKHLAQDDSQEAK